MRFMGIDYGTKRVGVALSDDTGVLAFPETVLENGKQLLRHITEICEQEKVQAIVLGESKNYKGADNPIMEAIHRFKETLEEALDLPVYLEGEFLTSVEAGKIHSLTDLHDAQAAALILQRYLDRQKTHEE